tara:strand:- start:202 stop:765 length:564 start_codon:yes stop_codon:yes gene_type:complete
MNPESKNITQLLQDNREGKTSADTSLLEVVYSELGQLARMHLSRERNDHTLQPTALVHEAWIKLIGHVGSVADRQHFFALASKVMRRVLTDHARGRGRKKRGGGQCKVWVNESIEPTTGIAIDYIELDETLTRLTRLNPRHARVVEMRVFGGLTIAETAAVLEISRGTVETDWFTARAWLRQELDRN